MNIHSDMAQRALRRKILVPRDRRQAVLDAALELFNERTYGATPMPLIAEKAEVGAGTIYRYFPSKEALANAVYRECKLSLQRYLSATGGDATGPREQFRGFWRGLWRFASEQPKALRFLETHHHRRYVDRASRDVNDAVFSGITDFIRRAQAVGAVRRGKPEVLIALAFGAFVGLLKEADEGRFKIDATVLGQAEQAVWEMLARPAQSE